MKTEKGVEDYLVEQAEKLGCMCEKLIRKEGRGWPDRTVITPNGIVGFVEVKKPHVGKLSPQQIETLKDLGQRKALTYVVDSKFSIDQTLRLLMNVELFNKE